MGLIMIGLFALQALGLELTWTTGIIGGVLLLVVLKVLFKGAPKREPLLLSATAGGNGENNARKALSRSIKHVLDGDNHEFRQAAKDILKNDPVFHFQPTEYNLPFAAQRELSIKRLEAFVKHRLISVNDILNNPLKFFACHEILSLIDPATMNLFTVQFNLFGGTVLKMGTERHIKQFVDSGAIDSLNVAGCFALTEVAHGVTSGMFMDTTATYDSATDEFVIQTPNVGAEKNWISFCADQAQVAVVFAQLWVNGVNEGVHGLLCDMRTAKQGPANKGIKVMDMGRKPMMNGNDNGRIAFDKVRVPSVNLLNRYCSIEGGKYSSQIPRARDRFLKVSDQLISGRMCMATLSQHVCRPALLSAVQYSIARVQNLPDGTPSNVFQRLSQKRALLPCVASVYGMVFATNYVKQRYAAKTEADYPEVVQLVCALKGYNSCMAVNITSICREKCGGQGLISINRMSEFCDLAATLVVVEGDSVILAQKVAKDLLFAAKQQAGGAAMMWLKGSASLFLKRTSLWLQGCRNILTRSWQQLMFAAREESIRLRLAVALNESMKKGATMMDAWSRIHLDQVVELHKAFVERLIFEKFAEAVENNKDAKDVHAVLSILCDLFALSRIEADMGLYMTHLGVSPATSIAISAAVNDILLAINEKEALCMVRAFGLPRKLISTPVSSRDGLWMNIV
eukprot:gnl/Hemi2/1560_TR559_c0_g1_i1.p1 gnl/Hemi2/1560_TR559_c0_g1~~gnl/Hemi2/1560_TR559_c0_g1_i1.p1  ORF type:complete len:684 (-),score=277.56 gnl/Hemi2/1560_TR559_c0_g1_i1:126-2177(-)